MSRLAAESRMAAADTRWAVAAIHDSTFALSTICHDSRFAGERPFAIDSARASEGLAGGARRSPHGVSGELEVWDERVTAQRRMIAGDAAYVWRPVAVPMGLARRTDPKRWINRGCRHIERVVARHH